MQKKNVTRNDPCDILNDIRIFIEPNWKMARSSAERVADYRARKKAEGMASLTLVVPAADVALFNQFAAQRREKMREGQHPSEAPRQQWLSMLAAMTPALPSPAAPRRKCNALGAPITRAQTLFVSLLKHIIQLGWPEGLPLGSEQDLIKIHGASRAAMRGAIRLLEHHSIVRVQRGTGGSVIVARPDLSATMQAVSVYLEYAGIASRDILATRRALELAVLDLVIERLDREGEQRLRDQIQTEAQLDGRAGADEFLRFHFLLAELCGDPALRLFDGIVLQLADAHSTFHRQSRPERDRVVARIKEYHRKIACAVIARDRDQARGRMAEYIAGIKTWLE
ncbi:DNA-binding transcriptional regulator, FadR family [Paraburkholderia diazotrophica]|uniref:DNA-binding transcriptional regulator, FadR family n=2 Tax=Paraburkholderia diazotrophica TaxID=667676 RepID=A0A1H7CIE5_9BURK|nr:DNA-binding transcriptional regulator, FadR family [Paraburkholderia diazotrophica]